MRTGKGQGCFTLKILEWVANLAMTALAWPASEALDDPS
jgi:hypothetical protein